MHTLTIWATFPAYSVAHSPVLAQIHRGTLGRRLMRVPGTAPTLLLHPWIKNRGENGVEEEAEPVSGMHSGNAHCKNAAKHFTAPRRRQVLEQRPPWVDTGHLCQSRCPESQWW